MSDEGVFRENVGFILTNGKGQVLVANRIKKTSSWQFPQGGIDPGENLERALYRELEEELGLKPEDVQVIAESQQWLTYVIPKRYRRKSTNCVGQKQKWFLLKLLSDESRIRLDHSHHPEFDQWKWVDKKFPADHIVAFKQDVYRKILEEFDEFL